jgi:hypothetical protein
MVTPPIPTVPRTNRVGPDDITAPAPQAPTAEAAAQEYFVNRRLAGNFEAEFLQLGSDGCLTTAEQGTAQRSLVSKLVAVRGAKDGFGVAEAALNL